MGFSFDWSREVRTSCDACQGVPPNTDPAGTVVFLVTTAPGNDLVNFIGVPIACADLARVGRFETKLVLVCLLKPS